MVSFVGSWANFRPSRAYLCKERPALQMAPVVAVWVRGPFHRGIQESIPDFFWEKRPGFCLRTWCLKRLGRRQRRRHPSRSSKRVAEHPWSQNHPEKDIFQVPKHSRVYIHVRNGSSALGCSGLFFCSVSFVLFYCILFVVLFDTVMVKQSLFFHVHLADHFSHKE